MGVDMRRMGEIIVQYRSDMTLKTGETLLLRSLNVQDAREAIDVCVATAGETPFLMSYADEWQVTLEKEREIIAQNETAPRALMLGAFVAGRLVGIGSIAPAHNGDRGRHRANVGVCVREAHWGKGIGTAMMRALIDAATRASFEQLELEVIDGNEAAIHLYRRLGFVQFGRRPRMVKYRDGTYADALLMALTL